MCAKPVTSSLRKPVKAVIAGLALSFALLGLAPQPAKAEVFVGFSSGDWHRHHHHWRYRFVGPRVLFFGPPVYYRPPPVVYVVPAPVYVPGPVYTEPLRVNPAGPSFRASNGLTCREYQTTVSVGGRMRNAYGTACLQPDGSWQVVN